MKQNSHKIQVHDIGGCVCTGFGSVPLNLRTTSVVGLFWLHNLGHHCQIQIPPEALQSDPTQCGLFIFFCSLASQFTQSTTSIQFTLEQVLKESTWLYRQREEQIRELGWKQTPRDSFILLQGPCHVAWTPPTPPPPSHETTTGQNDLKKTYGSNQPAP